MTVIRIHGLLSKEFGSHLKINLGGLNDVVRAIDAIKEGFRKKIIELQSKGYNFSIQKLNNEIHICPLLYGAGRSFMKIFSIFLIVVGIVLLCFGIPLGLSLISSGLQLAMAAYSKPKTNFGDMNSKTGGQTYAVQAGGKSYIFSNSNNLVSQGSFVALGYGLFKAGSSTINISIKSTPTNENAILDVQNSFSLEM
jgi:predicted phage tail protein